MAGYRPDIRAPVAEVIRHLPPALKRSIRAAIRAITADPVIGERLHGGLAGRFKYRVHRFRIVCRIDRARRVVHIVAVGHRRSVYEEVAELLRSQE